MWRNRRYKPVLVGGAAGQTTVCLIHFTPDLSPLILIVLYSGVALMIHSRGANAS